ncbi:hypothetical protein PR202_ga04652 [Eleusine coracana subsp. coracana]|uniref:Alpha/beta hydrolase fold-3 domain-containing protein n=1 Tax=Eleusine coracana subsp. coracana TaxID=191504 RepID=A0AAV5BQF9_ELECO|nr:hypothetical protein QOZ80_5AG0373390 [Eleusine coracana subsp. coracana]GJM88575.1 hypothetical protein PR202_ga04652 [Eleusine coracana subsp. coracana]
MASATTESQEAQAAASVVPSGRTVVDAVSGWLRVLDDGSVDRTWTGPPEALPLMQPVAPYSDPRDGHTLHDLPGEPNLRVYLPEAGKGEDRLPVIVHLHGGGFCISHPSWLMYHHFYSRLACAVPAVIVSVELPLAPEHRLPAHIDTGVAALRRLRAIFAQSNADAGGALNTDPAAELLRDVADISRVFLVGDSSGGNLVHFVAAQVGQDGTDHWAPLHVAGGVPIHPGFVRAERSRSELETHADSVFFTLDMLDKFNAMALPEGATREHPYTCPMGPQAPPLKSVPLPPMLVAVGEHDLVRDTDLEYCDALRSAGKDVEVLLSRGMSHAFYLNKFAVDADPATRERTRELIDAIASFVSRH